MHLIVLLVVWSRFDVSGGFSAVSGDVFFYPLPFDSQKTVGTFILFNLEQHLYTSFSSTLTRVIFDWLVKTCHECAL